MFTQLVSDRVRQSIFSSYFNRDQEAFSIKDHTVNILGFVCHMVSVAVILSLHHESSHRQYINEWICSLTVWEGVMDWIWSGLTILIPNLYIHYLSFLSLTMLFPNSWDALCSLQLILTWFSGLTINETSSEMPSVLAL
jgi:hypothetical protein